MNNTWTFGQYRLFRVSFGIYLFFHFLLLFPYACEIFSSSGVLSEANLSPLLYLFPNVLAITDSPIVIMIMTVIAMLASIGLVSGYHDKISAIIIWYVLASFFGRNPLIANPSLPYVGWMLFLHVAMPSQTCSEKWQFPKPLYFSVWFIMAVSYTYSGYTKLLSPSWVSLETIQLVLENPLSRDNWIRTLFLNLPPIFLKLLTFGILWLETLFIPLAFIPILRPWIWLGMLCAHFGFLTLLNLGDLSVGMILFHMISFNPAWLAPYKIDKKTAKIYYDGFCGFCHKTVQFVLKEDVTSQYQFAPLQGSTFKEYCLHYNMNIKNIPESLILVTPQGLRFYKSNAFVYILMSLGGYWRLFGILLKMIPTVLRDYGYDFIGKIRHQLFANPKNMCPLVPKEYQSKMLA